MRILHVVRGLKNASGITHIVGPLAEAQAREGADVSVYCIEQGRESPLFPDRAIVHCREFPLSIRFRPPNHPGISIPFAKTIRQEISLFDFVHVHAVWNYPTYFAMRSAHKKNIPYMVAPHGSFEGWVMQQSYWRKTIYGRFFESPLLNRAAYLQALTEMEAEQIRQYGIKSPIVIIPNGVDERNFRIKSEPLAKQLNLHSGRRTLLSLSRLHPKKGIDILIRAFALFCNSRQDVTLVIAGDDGGSGYRKKLEKLALQAGIGDNCKFIGEVSGRPKFDVLLGADAFALLSHSEGLPVAVLEAMSAALPVIITRACNIPDVPLHGAGVVVHQDVEEVAESLTRIFDDPERAKRMGSNGCRLVDQKFTWPAIARRTLLCYKTYLEER